MRRHCPDGYHAQLTANPTTFVSGTELFPGRKTEALWVGARGELKCSRNCRRCKTSITVPAKSLAMEVV